MPAGFYVRKGYRRLMEYAGWYEGRKVDISIAEQHYADHGAPRVNTSKRFSPKHFVLCFQWYLAQKKMGWTADFECVLFSCLTMSGCELAKIEDDRTVCGKGRLGDTQVLPRLLAIWEN